MSIESEAHQQTKDHLNQLIDEERAEKYRLITALEAANEEIAEKEDTMQRSLHNPETSHDKAIEFLCSTRGKYIVSQALYHALKVLGDVQPEVMQEKSNMDDMQYLREMLFDFPGFVFEPVDPSPDQKEE
jgi:hypothetical protein